MPKKEEKIIALTPEQITESISGLAAGLKTISESVTAITDGNKGIVDNIASLTDQISGLSDKTNKPVKKEAEPVSDKDIEAMDRMQFGNFLGGIIMDKLKKDLLDPLNTRLDGIDGTLETSSLQKELSQVAKDHDDFKLYKEDILNLSEKHPEHSVKALYLLAKDADPDRSKGENDDQGDPDKSKNTNVIDFGGLLPTSGSTSETTGNQDADSAADAAWDSVVGEGDAGKGPDS